ncbi:predicted protein [Francisella philomiragia subsp. philomiragia ATCC 25015]|nr:predicted protein [Francisella philomiragia subsp. philomiragia ATCC 25015]
MFKFRPSIYYKNLANLSVLNTTNHLNGRKFFDLKNKIKIHKGLPTKLKKK